MMLSDSTRYRLKSFVQALSTACLATEHRMFRCVCLAVVLTGTVASLGEFPACIAIEPTGSEVVREWIEQYSADVKSLEHRYRVPLDEEAIRYQLRIVDQWLKKLKVCDFAGLERDDQLDYLLLRSELEYQRERIQREHALEMEAVQLIPYWQPLVAICKNREDVGPIDSQQLAEEFDRLATQTEKLVQELHALAQKEQQKRDTETRLQALRSSQLVRQLGRCLREVDGFYSGYDPQYSWWTKQPVQRLMKAMDGHARALKEKVVGIAEDDEQTIIGLPIGAEGLELELKHEWIAHSPQELLELAHREMEWCDAAMRDASEELGFGADWRAAMEHVKAKHVPPGDQPRLIRELAWEAIRFLEANDLLTVPGLAAGGWRMTMMSPERQRVNPYFLGGDTIIVSYPTDAMTHEEKLMSMRSNNEHFSRATVHHELIPGHHLQHYMMPRYRPYRRIFSTPFWIEGWALYWEMLLWDLDFARNAEDRVGMLFWRKHRCARIIFSLGYHLGEMTPDECVDYLVERVGHERSAASAEVRRSIMGGYSPLYQAAYMLGGLQLRAMHRELVQAGQMTNREFHDAVLHENSIPIELLRAYLTQAPLSADMVPTWRFAEAAASSE